MFHDAYVLVTDYLLHRILIKARIVLEMTFLLMAKQLQCWCFDICNVIEVWLLWDYSTVDIITICYHNGLVFDTFGCIYIIWMTMDAIHRNYGQKSQTNSSGSYKSNRNKLIQYTLNETIGIMVMIVDYRIFALSMNEFNHIIDKILNFHLIIAMIDIIIYQIETIAALYVVFGVTLSFMVTHATNIQIESNLYSDATDSSLFCLVTNIIHDFHLILFVFSLVVTIIVQIDHIYIVRIKMVVMSTHKLNTNRHNGCKARIIQFMFNRNTNTIIVIHHEEFNVNIHKIDKFYSITNTANNYDTIIIVINMVDIITHQLDNNVFKFDVVVSRMNTTNTDKIFKILQFIVVIIDTARMSMEIILMVLQCSSLQLFSSPLDRMIHAADILIQLSTIPPRLDALTDIFDKININLGKASEFQCNYNAYGNITIVIINVYNIGHAAFVIGFFVDAVYFIKQLRHGSPLNIVVELNFTQVLMQLHNQCSSAISAVNCHSRIILLLQVQLIMMYLL